MSMCGRKCWNCGHDGHNSQTCKKGCIEITLFGVQIAVQSEDGPESTSIRKSKSLGNLQSCNLENAAAAATATPTAEPSGYLSDGLVHQSSKSYERKRGKPWSEEEHRSFLAGLEKLGKGDWKGISISFVPSRSSSQVASHAQKYFNRLSASTEKKRRRASVFDISLHHKNKPSNKVDESLLPATSSTAASMNASELKGQPSLPAPIGTTSERPPLSPMKRHGIPAYLPSMVYQPGAPSLTKGFPTQTVIPTVTWVPVVNFSSHDSVFLPDIRVVVPQPSVAMLQPGPGSSSQALSAVLPASTNNELNLNIRNLRL